MIDAFQVQRRIDQFNEMHGPFVNVNGWYYHVDGAMRDGNALGPLIDQPREPRQRCRNIVTYWNAILKGKVSEFDELKERLIEEGSQFGNEEAGLSALKKKRRQVRWAKLKLKEANEELRKTEPGYQPPEVAEARRREDAEREARKTNFRTAVKSIHI